MADLGRGQRLLGRASECDALRSLLADVGSGTSRVLLLRGEAGVGKSALLDYMVSQAADFHCVHVAGVESDMELAFAGLQQLCAPLMTHADELPKPQSDALAVAFGRGVGPTPDRFLVGLAVLSLLAAAANAEPVLCVIDDAQWLDQVSIQTLAFVARRLMAEPVALIFAARPGSAEALAGLEELPVDPLSISDAHALLDSVVRAPIDERVRDRIVAETRGIPLALLEVPRNVPASELAGGFWNPGLRPSVGQIEEGFVRRIQALPAETRRLLLAAAAEPVGDAALFLRVAAQLGIPVEALAPAESAGVIEFGPRMRFHHPLVRSAAYRAADLADRRAIHAALAAATDPQFDPDRRAWHAAHAAAGPDDAVAADLEASAGRAQTRGGVAAAAAFLERAAGLTSDPAHRAARAIAAAQAKWEAAAPEAAHELLAVAELGPLSELQRAQIARLRAQMEFARSRGGDPGAPPLVEPATQLLEAARRIEELDDELARDAYLEALAAAMYAARLGEPATMTAVARAACAALGRAPKLDRPTDLLLSGMANRIADGIAAGTDPMRAALELMCAQEQENRGQSLRWMTLGLAIVQESATGELWDDELYLQLASDVVRQARDAGALTVLPPALAYRAGVHVLAGEFATAATLIEEAASITASTGYAPLRYHALSLAAWQGNPSTAGLLESAAAEATARGEGRVLGLTGYLAAILYNGLGRYDEAFASAQRACEFEDLGFFGWCLMELIEAAVHTGAQEVAAAALDQMQKRTESSGTHWGLGALASAQALLADDASADRLFTEAIEHLECTHIAVFLARTHLCYGEWLRRMNRRVDARIHLHEAHEMFTRMGADAFAERARRELIATGEKARKKTGNSGDELTPQEAQIARLASEGLTNQEIGAQLFISTHTVEWHLRKVFVKLGVTSRRQLRTISWAS